MTSRTGRLNLLSTTYMLVALRRSGYPYRLEWDGALRLMAGVGGVDGAAESRRGARDHPVRQLRFRAAERASVNRLLGFLFFVW